MAEALTDISQLSTLRNSLHEELTRALVPDRTRSDFVSAVSEVAVNGILRGRPPVQVRVWASLSRLVATVTDQGDGLHDPLAGYLPSRGRDPRRAGTGLWLARQLCHQLETSRAEEGFTVRLITTIPEPTVPDLEHVAQAQGSAEAFKACAAKARDRAAEMLRRPGQGSPPAGHVSLVQGGL